MEASSRGFAELTDATNINRGDAQIHSVSTAEMGARMHVVRVFAMTFARYLS
jgi:hypothetical protein